MAISLVNKLAAATLGSSGGSITVPATTVGNLLVLAIGSAPSGQSASAFTITGGGTWTINATIISVTGRNETLLIAYAVCTASVTSISVALSGEGAAAYAYYELSGVDNSSPIDVIGGSPTADTVTLVPTQSGDFGVALTAGGNSTASWYPWTDNGTAANFWYISEAYNPSLAAGSQSVTNTFGASMLAAMFAPGSSGPVTIALVEQTWAWGVQSAGAGRQMALVEQGWSWGVQALKATGRLSLSVKSWRWLTQAADLALRHPLTAQSWSWGTQPLSLKAFLALASKSWSWLTQPIQIVQSGTVQLAAKLWAWTGQTLGAAKRFALATKSWNWSTQSLYKVGQLTLAGKTWAWQTAAVTYHWLLALAGQLWHWQTQAIGGGSVISALGALLKWPLFWLWG